MREILEFGDVVDLLSNPTLQKLSPSLSTPYHRAQHLKILAPDVIKAHLFAFLFIELDNVFFIGQKLYYLAEDLGVSREEVDVVEIGKSLGRRPKCSDATVLVEVVKAPEATFVVSSVVCLQSWLEL
ncbi:hypothetical protein I314_06775 [Cryptococcus bacillisporus CA1873]|uniref:Uncharacterized protein n=1 Tax=Cryptococcus bacillisporus CA1873 TaxID=1296111 RepID=A0ABR5B1E3_CRYGA|nr:hypothetical protein I314_06775 [Cryptococcus bacillisporus CA1873]|eukprot:KIR57413.1 hypothetical protein I314_06775 [Cryptococcus gattii CA1873]